MTRITKVCVLAIGLVAAAAGGACGGNSEMSFLPTSPTGIGTPAGAVITGRVTGVTTPVTSIEAFSATDSRALTVSIVGTSISTTINGSGQFTLSGVPPGTVQLKFSGSGIDATVMLAGVTATDQIEITVSLNGANARLDSERRGRGNGEAELKGPVASLGGTCPAVNFILQGARVSTGSETTFDDITCAGLRNGVQVEVHGQRQADGSVLATRIEAEEEDNGPRTDIEGVVSGLTGQCPAIVFTVQGTRVTTTGATSFRDMSCAAVADGMRVKLRGQRQADGSILASRVEEED